MATVPLVAPALRLLDFEKATQDLPNTEKMPLLFIGHGHPMNALWDNSFTQSLAEVGKSVEKPNAIMVISAHWETRGTFVSVNPKPTTIYDFGSFDNRLFQIKYEPAGHPELARATTQLVEGTEFKIQEDTGMGLDHGAWTVLHHMFPNADIPVFQMSIDYSQPAEYHYKLGQALQKMREKGVLILGSGNIVHNLGMLNWREMDAKPHDWAVEFDDMVKKRLDDRNFEELIYYRRLGNAATMSVPSNDHYLPMMYTLGLAQEKDELKYTFEGFQFAGVGMRCFQFS